MSWNDIDKSQSKQDIEKLKNEQREKHVEINKAYARLFSTEEGKKVIEDLNNRFIYGNDIPLDAQNINYQAAYVNGEMGVIKYILHRMSQAKE